MARIAIDCRLAAQKTGLGRYVRELVPLLVTKEREHAYILLVHSCSEEWLAPLANRCTIMETSCAYYTLREQYVIPRMLRSSGADLFFCPHFNVPFRPVVPFVATIHDLILHQYPNQAPFFKRLAYRILFYHTVQKARSLIAVSAFTARAIQEAYGAEAYGKTTIIQEGISERFQPQSAERQQRVLRKYDIPLPYFLYVGNAKEHKNVPVLLEAFHSLQDPNILLLLVTGGAELQQLDLGERVRVLSNIDDEDLPALYSGARAFVTASLYEGFCFPVLEARACGCPVIASRRTAIPEVAGPDTVLVEPSVQALAKAMQSPPHPHTTTKDEFRWQDAAQTTLAVLHAALE
ncbi:MAG: glycosyltransferase family 1 protein [Candidatus Peribacteraceae bacterium]|jgi:glycosyltransferase involved in cell wall biosynthesis